MEARENELQPGITAVIGCMNRNERIGITLPILLSHDAVSQIVVVDWGSEIPLAPELQKYTDDERLTLVRVDGVSAWNSARANNLAVRFATFETLAKLDADYEVKPGYFEKHQPSENEVYRGNWRKARNENEYSLTGSLVLRTSLYRELNGFNERICGWGYEDREFYQRVQDLGYTVRDIDYDYIHHIPHDISQRSVSGPLMMINNEKNERFAKRAPWSLIDSQCEYEITMSAPNSYSCILRSGPRPEYKAIEEACIDELLSFYRRAVLRRFVQQNGGSYQGYTSEELERLFVRHAPQGVGFIPWKLRRELKELYGYVLRAIGKE